VLKIVVLIVIVVVSYYIYRYYCSKKEESTEKKVEEPAPLEASVESSAWSQYPMRGSIMDQRAAFATEAAEGEVLSKDASEPSGGARALPSADELAEQSMDQYAKIAESRRASGGRTRQEGEDPMFHSQFYYEEGVEQHPEVGSGDSEREVMTNLVSATGGLLTQAEDLFAAGNDAYERDAWGMYKPSLATLKKARDLGSRVAGGTLAQASDSWGGRSVGGNGVTADPSRSLYALQDLLADSTKVPVDTFVQNVLSGNITAGGALPLSQMPSYIS